MRLAVGRGRFRSRLARSFQALLQLANLLDQLLFLLPLFLENGFLLLRGINLGIDLLQRLRMVGADLRLPL